MIAALLARQPLVADRGRRAWRACWTAALLALEVRVQAILLGLLRGLLAVGAHILQPLRAGGVRLLAVLLVLGGGGDAVGVLLGGPLVIGFLLLVGGALDWPK